MAIKKLNTNITSIRDGIPGDLMSISSFLGGYGWTLSLKSSKEGAVQEGQPCTFVTAEKRKGLPIYEYSYFIQSIDEADVIHGLRKLAELCIQINETFTGNSYPEGFVSHDGFIYENIKISEESKKSKTEFYHYLSEQRKNRKSPDGIYFSYGFLNFSWDAQNVILNMSQIKKISELAHESFETK